MLCWVPRSSQLPFAAGGPCRCGLFQAEHFCVHSRNQGPAGDAGIFLPTISLERHLEIWPALVEGSGFWHHSQWAAQSVFQGVSLGNLGLNACTSSWVSVSCVIPLTEFVLFRHTKQTFISFVKWRAINWGCTLLLSGNSIIPRNQERAGSCAVQEPQDENFPLLVSEKDFAQQCSSTYMFILVHAARCGQPIKMQRMIKQEKQYIEW